VAYEAKKPGFCHLAKLQFMIRLRARGRTSRRGGRYRRDRARLVVRSGARAGDRGGAEKVGGRVGKTLIYKRDLQPIHNLKATLREIRDYFAGNVTGITRDETIAQTMLRLLFCKIVDEQEKAADQLVDFANRPDEDPKDLAQRIQKLFHRVKQRNPDAFDANETIDLDADALSYVVSKLQEYALLTADRDIIADAFEELIGTSFRGGEGQFFTPRNVVLMMIEMLSPRVMSASLTRRVAVADF